MDLNVKFFTALTKPAEESVNIFFMLIHLFLALECFTAVDNILLPRCYLSDFTTCKVHVHYKQPAIWSLVTLKLSYLYVLTLI